MRKQVLLILLMAIPFVGNTQKIHRQYTFYPQEGGNVYFIRPQKVFESNNAEALKKLVYDITYLAGRDSVSFTFTYYTHQVLKIDSVRLLTDKKDVLFEGKAITYFIQPKKNYWQQRASLTLPYELLVKTFQEDNSFIISLMGGKSINYQMKPKVWKKQSQMVSNIFNVVKYNN
ncbi:MAG: hypothetical protein LBL58_11520 [Tannerellaceae bacterium]|jgi:hypothetical protein|nr:hypothetical protein [Tannerellaceae bacterium]